MKRLGHILMCGIVWAAVITIVVPITLLLAWCAVNRWPWPELFPSAWTTRGIDRLFSGHMGIWRILLSSVSLSLSVAAISTLIAAMAARALCFYRVRGEKLIGALVLLPVIVPATVFGMGSHMILIQLRLNNTVPGVMLTHLICTLPYAVKIMVDVTRSVSQKLEEQAQVLGASPARAILHGFLPAISPGIVSAAAVSFLMSYNQYFLTMLVGGGKVKTMAILVMPLISGSDRTISSVYSVLFVLSSLMVFVLFQLVSNALSERFGGNLGL